MTPGYYVHIETNQLELIKTINYVDFTIFNPTTNQTCYYDFHDMDLISEQFRPCSKLELRLRYPTLQ